MSGYTVGSDAWKQRKLGEYINGMRNYRGKLEDPDKDFEYTLFERKMNHLIAHCLMGGDVAENLDALHDKIREEE